MTLSPRKLFAVFLLLTFVLKCEDLFAEKKFAFGKNCQLAYYSMMSLKLEEGKKYLAQERKENPDNLMPDFIENYSDFFLLTINENSDELSKLEGNKEKRLNALSGGSEESPWYLYTQAEVNLQWALVHLKFEQYYTAFFEIKKAYNQLTTNEEKFPNFTANKKSLGLVHALIGAVPESYKWAASFLGFSGTIEQGMNELNDVLEHGKQTPYLFTRETKYIYAYLQMMIMSNPKESWNIVTQNDFPDYRKDLLACYMRGHMAIKNGLNDVAIETFSSAPVNSEYMPFHYIDYMLGMCKMNRLDSDANVPLEKFIKEFKGRNYLKDAYQKLAWYWLLQQNETKYNYYLAFCKTVGTELTDSDKQAKAEAENGIEPNIFLLKVRLTQDGGYYDKALSMLSGKSSDDFLSMKDKIEFTYRAGRIFQEKKDLTKALQYFQWTIDRGEKYPYYFAANAALQSALIYEEQKNNKKAAEYFHKCIAMKNVDYKNSLDSKAKAGLERVEKK